MNPHLTQLTRFLDDRGRLYRLTPVTELPMAERFSQVERILDRAWDLARHLGIDPGGKPTLTYTGKTTTFPEDSLRYLSYLETEVLCTFLMLGLGQAHTRALHELAISGPAKPMPNWKVIVDEEYEKGQEFLD